MIEKIKQTLIEKVNPILGEHDGGVTFVSFENGIVTVKLHGACSTCPSAQSTNEGVIKEILMEEVPEVKDVILDMSVSDELLAMARKILNKEIQS